MAAPLPVSCQTDPTPMPLNAAPAAPNDAPPPAGSDSPGFLARWWKWILGGIGVLVLAAFITAASIWHYLFHDMPSLPENGTLWEVGREQAMEFRARDGTLLAIRGPKYGRAIELTDLPPHVWQAFIAAEDRRFYEHEGMDTSAIIRALWANWRAGATVQGASTLTQQLVKNLVLTPEQTFKRKAQEIRLAQELERRLTKDEILGLYLNRVYLGAQAYGIDAAARTYFGKSATELTLGEATLLAGLPKAPSRLALDTNLDGAKERQVYVLDQMLEEKFIDITARDAALAEDVTLTAFIPDSQFGYVIDAATASVAELLPNTPNDLVITLTIDAAEQTAARERLEAIMARDGEALKASQAAALFMRPNGEVRVMIGGRSYADSQFNRATQSQRQPGSAFKTFVFAAAFESGLDPFTIRDDAPVKIERWTPDNYSRGFLGPVTLAEAFSKSLNTVAASLGQEVGTKKVAELATRLGIRSKLDPVPSIALGTQEVNLMELTSAYGVFANEGKRVEPWFIQRIEDSRGRVLYERQTLPDSPLLDDDVREQMNAMMLAVVIDGTGTRAAVPGWDVAGKTGTSQDWRDAWFVGYTATLVGSVWVGNDDNSSMKEVTGGGLPAEIWSTLARDLLKGDKPVALPGADISVTLNPEDEEKIIFYRDLSAAFRSVEDRG